MGHITVFHIGLWQERPCHPGKGPLGREKSGVGQTELKEVITESRELEERHGDLRSLAR